MRCRSTVWSWSSISVLEFSSDTVHIRPQSGWELLLNTKRKYEPLPPVSFLSVRMYSLVGLFDICKLILQHYYIFAFWFKKPWRGTCSCFNPLYKINTRPWLYQIKYPLVHGTVYHCLKEVKQIWPLPLERHKHKKQQRYSLSQSPHFGKNTSQQHIDQILTRPMSIAVNVSCQDKLTCERNHRGS